ncbi:signal peptide containing protein [Streptococcus pseudoporcinus]|uniref:Signal peptide containing protein n=1 Tax=Streptococcus pseudoporcinus TaxID=361101 RepID=A0A4U9XP60_9STRE|nr:excalibur calcium-binding domain-containing protein [Streptococcus pseudoporcinus]VTS14515.1 signal peptide containing protein [Streptococcus pseudoporcinus]
MKNKSCFTTVLYIILGITILSIILMAMPILLVAGVIGLWFYTKKKPNRQRRNYALIATVIGLIGTMMLGSGYTFSSKPATNKEQETPNTLISSTSKKTVPQNQDKDIRDANQAISQLEKDTNPVHLEKAREAIKHLKNNKDKALLEKRFYRLEQKIYIEEAEKATKEVETTKTKDLLEIAKEKIGLISDSTKRNPFMDRIYLVSKAIEEQEVQKVAESDAENAVKQLEDNQNRDKVSYAEEKVNKITNTTKKANFTNRIQSVITSIETRETQAAAQQFVQAPPSNTRYYANCTEMRNAGAAPIQQGQPGYETRLDRDHDGWACE